MIRGTTPTHNFRIPFESSTLEEVRIIYSQNDEQILVKETADCEMDGNTISVTLTQEDTFKFDCKKCVQLQVRVLTNGGQALASQIKHIDVDKCLDDEVIV